MNNQVVIEIMDYFSDSPVILKITEIEQFADGNPGKAGFVGTNTTQDRDKTGKEMGRNPP